jgi:hypothetical protein
MTINTLFKPGDKAKIKYNGDIIEILEVNITVNKHGCIVTYDYMDKDFGGRINEWDLIDPIFQSNTELY